MAAPRSEALTELLHLHNGGRLAERYPVVRGLVERLPPAERLRAGRLLAALDPDEVARAHPDAPGMTVAVTGHGTLPDLVPALAAELARAGLLMRPVVSHFDGYVADLSDPASDIYAADPDVVLCVLDHGVVVDRLPTPWTVDDAERSLTEQVRVVEGLAARFAATARGTLVLNTFPPPLSVVAQLIDLRSRARLARAWHESAARLLALAAEHPNVAVLDLGPLSAEGIEVEDPRLRAYAGANLSPALLARYAREVGGLARGLSGRARKVLAVDLDGTLWGGILGEDGVEGIESGEGYRGAAFRRFQCLVKQIGSQGVLLAAVSKNDPEAVEEALRDHPGLALRADDFVAVLAGWGPKHAALRDLAGSLNLAVDSIVFADDSPHERGVVRRKLPGVAVVDLDDEPALHAGRLLDGGWFDIPALTEDDRERPARYRTERARQRLRESFDSPEDYLRTLGIEVRLASAVEADVDRVSQMTLRTNQFNLTVERLRSVEVRARLRDPAAHVLTICAGDRFGDSGLVGAIFLNCAGNVLHLDNFVLSCRVFARGIEQACLATVLEHARAAGVTEVTGRHRQAARNAMVKDFLGRNGFDVVGEDGPVTSFRHTLERIAPAPPHIRLTDAVGVPGGTPR
jgi:FkbH-like protein